MFGIEEVTHTGIQQRVYHIGECCYHGTVKIAWLGTKLRIRYYIYKTDKLMEEFTFDFVDKNKVSLHLEEYSTCYYGDKMLNDFYA